MLPEKIFSSSRCEKPRLRGAAAILGEQEVHSCILRRDRVTSPGAPA